MKVGFDFEGNEIFFVIRNPEDLIQSYHAKGRFYESEELEIMRKHFQGGVFVDIGANVGNHTVFAAKVMKADLCVSFEANSVAADVLRENITENNLLEKVDLSNVGKVVTSRKNKKFVMTWKDQNLGGARAWANPDGSLDGVYGDEALIDFNVSYIKIDVEGNELDVLESLTGTINRCRPRIFIEVDNRNEVGFLAWLEGSGYFVAHTYKRYEANQNYFLTHR